MQVYTACNIPDDGSFVQPPSGQKHQLWWTAQINVSGQYHLLKALNAPIHAQSCNKWDEYAVMLVLGLGLIGLALAKNSRPKSWRTTMYTMSFHRLEWVIFQDPRSLLTYRSHPWPFVMVQYQLHSQPGWPWPWPWDCGLGLGLGLECSGLVNITANMWLWWPTRQVTAISSVMAGDSALTDSNTWWPFDFQNWTLCIEHSKPLALALLRDWFLKAHTTKYHDRFPSFQTKLLIYTFRCFENAVHRSLIKIQNDPHLMMQLCI